MFSSSWLEGLYAHKGLHTCDGVVPIFFATSCRSIKPKWINLERSSQSKILRCGLLRLRFLHCIILVKQKPWHQRWFPAVNYPKFVINHLDILQETSCSSTGTHVKMSTFPSNFVIHVSLMQIVIVIPIPLTLSATLYESVAKRILH